MSGTGIGSSFQAETGQPLLGNGSKRDKTSYFSGFGSLIAISTLIVVSTIIILSQIKTVNVVQEKGLGVEDDTSIVTNINFFNTIKCSLNNVNTMNNYKYYQNIKFILTNSNYKCNVNLYNNNQRIGSNVTPLNILKYYITSNKYKNDYNKVRNDYNLYNLELKVVIINDINYNYVIHYIKYNNIIKINQVYLHEKDNFNQNVFIFKDNNNIVTQVDIATNGHTQRHLAETIDPTDLMNLYVTLDKENPETIIITPPQAPKILVKESKSETLYQISSDQPLSDNSIESIINTRPPDDFSPQVFFNELGGKVKYQFRQNCEDPERRFADDVSEYLRIDVKPSKWSNFEVFIHNSINEGSTDPGNVLERCQPVINILWKDGAAPIFSVPKDSIMDGARVPVKWHGQLKNFGITLDNKLTLAQRSSVPAVLKESEQFKKVFDAFQATMDEGETDWFGEMIGYNLKTIQ